MHPKSISIVTIMNDLIRENPTYLSRLGVISGFVTRKQCYNNLEIDQTMYLGVRKNTSVIGKENEVKRDVLETK